VLADHVLDSKPMTGVLGWILSALPGAHSKAGLLGWAVGASLFIFLFNSLADATLSFAWIRVGQRMVFDLTQDLFAAAQRRSLLFHARSSVGDLLMRITGDSWGLYTATDSLIFTPGHAIANVLFMIIVMARMDVGLTLLSVAVAPFMAGSVLLLGKPLRSIAEKNRELQSSLHSHVQQTLRGVVVRV